MNIPSGTRVGMLICLGLEPVGAHRRLKVCNAWPVRFQRTERHHQLSGTKLCCLLPDLLSSPISHHCVWSGITGHNLTPEKRDNKYMPQPLTPTSCLRTKFNL